jgi:hypothetical protein
MTAKQLAERLGTEVRRISFELDPMCRSCAKAGGTNKPLCRQCNPKALVIKEET